MSSLTRYHKRKAAHKPFLERPSPSASETNLYHLKSRLREARKHQTIREITSATRGNAILFGKRLSPCAETSNLSGNDFRHARKCQTFRETTFAMRGNAKPFGKRLSPCAETPNHSGNDFRHARKHQTIWEMTFAKRGNIKPFGK